MRQMTGAAAFMAIALSAAPAAARDYPYCLQGREWGYPGNCEFMSYPQCQATASGTDSYCGLTRVLVTDRSRSISILVRGGKKSS